MEWKVQLFRLNFDEREEHAVVAVARSGWLTMGQQTQEFERRFATLIGREGCAVAVASGTAALHLALLALGIGPGDEVVVSGLTFIADVNVVQLVGATPVLADCTSYDDWNVSPTDIERKITPRTRAIMPVHYAGYPCDMEGIRRLCERHHLALVEDSAHAIGAYYDNQHCGTFGAFGCFSFFSNKNLSVGEGGMIACQSPEEAGKLRLLRSHGMSAPTLDRHLGRAVSYDVILPGLNYRIDEFRAAIGIVQIEKLAAANEHRKALAQRYNEQLASIGEVQMPFLTAPRRQPCYHIYPILLDRKVDRAAVIQSLKAQGIQSSVHYPAIQRFKAYADYDLGETPLANDISERELTLPLYPTMREADLALVVDALKQALA
jgi:dTDP-4-amino-4,6-dideoxygalactose transaminase